MLLVDTSVLIEYLRGLKNITTERFQYVLENNITFGINYFIYQEVLQGVKTERDFNTVKKYLDTQRFYSLKNNRESYAEAARIYLKCRKRGITITSTIDCLIAQTALENNLLLLHNDTDFDRMQIIVGLKVFKL
ncbi:MAG: PIN domain-containing protein [Thermodesulfobacteriota bacterium]